MGKTNSTKKDQKAPGRINWDIAKAKYMKSRHTVLVDFAREELGIEKLSSFHRRKMAGWLQEKKDIIKGVKEGAESDLEEKVKKAYEVPMEQLEKLKKGVFDVLMARLGQVTNNIKVETDPNTGKQNIVVTGDVPTKELIDILKVVKTEM